MKRRRRNSTTFESRARSASTAESRPAAISDSRIIVSRSGVVRSLERRCGMAGEPQLYESGNSIKRAASSARGAVRVGGGEPPVPRKLSCPEWELKLARKSLTPRGDLTLKADMR